MSGEFYAPMTIVRGHPVLPLSVHRALKSWCNQLLPEFSSNQSETLRRYCQPIEDVHVTFLKKKNLTKLRHLFL